MSMKRIFILSILTITCNFLKAQMGWPVEISKSEGAISHIELVDINGDGDNDILTIVPNGNRIFWQKADGKGGFGSVNEITLQSGGAEIVHAGDIDGDGDMDILALTSSVIWYENLGTSGFGTGKVIASSSEGVALGALADADNDGDLDLFLTHRDSSKVVWMKNDGSGSFGLPITITSKTALVQNVHAADLNGDGNIDFMVTSRETDEVVWFENLGNGIFELDKEKVAVDDLDYPDGVETQDLNNDGDLDLVVVRDYGGKKRYYLNNGDGSFGRYGKFGGSSGEPHTGGQFADIDGDGDLDFIVVSDGNVTVFENTNGPSFVTKHTLFPNLFLDSRHLRVDDVNGDGKVDIVVTNTAKTDWYENLGGLDFEEPKLIYANIGLVTSFASVDFDKDGDLDLLATKGLPSRVVWFENNGRGSFGHQQNIVKDISGVQPGYWNITPSDLNLDGKMDVIVREGDKIVWFENLGNGQFSLGKTIASKGIGHGYLKIAVVDYDDDKDLDVVWESQGGTRLQENLGSENFAPYKAIAGENGFHFADMNNDGKLDWFTVGPSWDETSFKLHINMGNGVYKRKTYGGPTPVGRGGIVYPMDVDVDGDIDVLQLCHGDPHRIYLHRNQGNGVFDLPKYVGKIDEGWKERGYGKYLTYMQLDWRDFKVGDLDADGDPDLFWGIPNTQRIGNENGIAFCENLQGDSFVLSQIVSLDQERYSLGPILEAADYDQDGDLDIVGTRNKRTEIVLFEGFFGSPYQLKGTAFYDANQNGEPDKGEEGLSNLKAVLTNAKSYPGRTNEMGEFAFGVNPGTHTVSHSEPGNLWKLTTDSSSYTRTLGPANLVEDELNFGFYPSAFETHIGTRLNGSFPRCNRGAYYWINIQNNGTTLPNGVVHLKLDDSVTYIMSRETPDSVVGQNIYWHVKNMGLNSTRVFRVHVTMPAFNLIDNDLSSAVTFSELDGNGQVVYTNGDTAKQRVRCSYDPNDKAVSPIGFGTNGFITPKEELTYRIRFQNTGNDTAFQVMIRDPLDDDLDWSTMNPLASSHPYEVQLEADGDLVFKFDSIMLPDSNVNEPESHGFVEFSISPKADIVPLTTIDGPAKIYFDFNAPVVTNTVLNTIVCYRIPTPEISLKDRVLEAGVVGDFEYQWYLDGQAIEGADESFLEPEEEGEYTV